MLSAPSKTILYVCAALAVLLAPAAVLAESRFLAPSRGQAFTAGEIADVRWTRPCTGGADASESELLLSLDGGLTFPIRLTAEMPACAASLRWRIPSVETRKARLALRTGSGEESGSERLEAVSAEFAISAGGADAAQDLMTGGRELWTRQALEGEGAEKMPVDSMTGAGERIVTESPAASISEPTPPGSVDRTSSAMAPLGQVRSPLPASRVSIVSRLAAPLPLRL